MKRESNKRSAFTRPYAFTLVELLVVVSVIGILGAILFPVFGKVREKARASACVSNYHQIGLAVHMYAQDADGLTPPDGGSFSGLIKDCEPYTKVESVFACPDDYDRADEKRAGSYRMATLYQGKPLSCGWDDPYSLGKATRPTATVLAYEAEQDFAQSPIVPTFRHGNGTQVLFFDAHVQWIPGKSIDTDN